MKAITADLLARAVGCGLSTAAVIAEPLRKATAAYGIDASSRRLGAFLAQVGHESLSFTHMEENLFYSAKRLREVCASARPGSRWRALLPRVGQLAGNPQALGNAAYGGRMGNGPEESGDGYRYRGRGWIQLTGAEAYEKARDRLRARQPDVPDFVANPDAVMQHLWAAMTAADYWSANGLNRLADEQQFDRITRVINGGDAGAKDRRERYGRAMAALTA